MPLVVDKATGRKFGKTEAGAVWLDSAKTIPTQFYQFWINSDDADVESYLKIFTLLSKEQIEQVMSDHHSDPGQRKAQKTLAEEVTKLVHGEEASELAQENAAIISGSVSPSAPPEGGISHTLHAGISLVDALVETGLCESKSEAHRLIDSGGVYINDRQTMQESLQKSDLDEGHLLLRRGKKYQNSVVVNLE
jgi:tyrosyl-tRNA synthetase